MSRQKLVFLVAGKRNSQRKVLLSLFAFILIVAVCLIISYLTKSNILTDILSFIFLLLFPDLVHILSVALSLISNFFSWIIQLNWVNIATIFGLPIGLIAITLAFVTWRFPRSVDTVKKVHLSVKTKGKGVVIQITSLYIWIVNVLPWTRQAPLPFAVKQSCFFPDFGIWPDAEEVYGQEVGLGELTQTTDAKASSAFVGPSKIGKTWLMHYFHHKISHEVGYKLIDILDANEPDCSTEAMFTARALEILHCRDLIGNDPGKLTLKDLGKAVKRLKKKNEVGILCIDEFDRLDATNPDRFSNNFFKGLRGLCSPANSALVLIITSQREPSEISPALTFFRIIRLPGFTEKEAREFIAKKGEEAGFNEDEKELLLAAARREDDEGKPVWPPHLLQGAGWLLEKKKTFGSHAPDYLPADRIYQKRFIDYVRQQYQH